MNINRFYATIPFSLDMIKLREVYDKVYRNSLFSFFICEKEYSTRVINVTFNYSVKEFNKLGKDTYIRNGYLARNVDFEDCACVRDGQLIGIKCGEPVENPLPPERSVSSSLCRMASTRRRPTSPLRCPWLTCGMSCTIMASTAMVFTMCAISDPAVARASASVYSSMRKCTAA